MNKDSILTTHEDVIFSGDSTDPPLLLPPPEPPPRPALDPPTIPLPLEPPSQSIYESKPADKWDKMSGDNSTNNMKTFSSVPLITRITKEKEEIELVNMINNTHVMIKLQYDGGANTSVTNDILVLQHVADVQPYSIGGIGNGIECTKKGNQRQHRLVYIISIDKDQQVETFAHSFCSQTSHNN